MKLSASSFIGGALLIIGLLALLNSTGLIAALLASITLLIGVVSFGLSALTLMWIVKGGLMQEK